MKKKVLLITGGSRGIGAATALLAAERGYTVAISYRRDAAAAEAVLGGIRRTGGEALALEADVSREADVMRLFEDIDRSLGPLAGLVNNAGILDTRMRLDEMDAARIERIFAVNVLGSFLCAREAVRRMSTLRGGTGGAIVNVSSIGARLGSPGEYIDYAASKGAVDVLTIGLGKEVAAEGIRVNGVRPGLIYTEIHADGGEPDRVDRLKSAVPMGRGGQPEEVARTILWLLSEESSYVTGATLDVGGGR